MHINHALGKIRSQAERRNCSQYESTKVKREVDCTTILGEALRLEGKREKVAHGSAVHEGGDRIREQGISNDIAQGTGICPGVCMLPGCYIRILRENGREGRSGDLSWDRCLIALLHQHSARCSAQVLGQSTGTSRRALVLSSRAPVLCLSTVKRWENPRALEIMWPYMPALSSDLAIDASVLALRKREVCILSPTPCSVPS